MIGKKAGYDVFLGGTTNHSTWRNEFLDLLKEQSGAIKCFNPVVENWTQECIDLENFVKLHAKYHVYVITPRMAGVYSIAEMCESTFDSTKKTFIYIRSTDIGDDGIKVLQWDAKVKNSINATTNMLARHGAIIVKSMEDLVDAIASNYHSTPIARKI